MCAPAAPRANPVAALARAAAATVARSGALSMLITTLIYALQSVVTKALERRISSLQIVAVRSGFALLLTTRAILARADAAPGGGDDALGDDALEGGGEARLRPVSREDFELALRKLSASVSERGKELSRVLEWNDEYGEIKRKKKRPNLSMYL